MTLLPRIGDDVMLNVPGREHVLSRVIGMGAGTLELDLVDTPRTPRPQLDRQALYIDFINDEGYARLHGRADANADRAEPWARRDAGLLRFAHKGTPLLMQRREHIRAQVQLAVRVVRAGARDPHSTAAETLDVGGGGMLVRGMPAPRVGEEYIFDLEIPGASVPVHGRFRVVSVPGADRAGGQFTALEQEDRMRIMSFAVEAAQDQRRSMR